jgi:hypothetical protein
MTPDDGIDDRIALRGVCEAVLDVDGLDMTGSGRVHGRELAMVPRNGRSAGVTAVSMHEEGR